MRADHQATSSATGEDGQLHPIIYGTHLLSTVMGQALEGTSCPVQEQLERQWRFFHALNVEGAKEQCTPAKTLRPGLMRPWRWPPLHKEFGNTPSNFRMFTETSYILKTC